MSVPAKLRNGCPDFDGKFTSNTRSKNATRFYIQIFRAQVNMKIVTGA